MQIRIRSSVGARTLEARQRVGLTQRELAKRARVAQSTLSRIEGDVVSPSFEDITRIARALGWPLLFFATGRERSGTDPRDLVVQLAFFGMRDMDVSSVPLIGEVRPFEEIIAMAAAAGAPRLIEAIPALLLLNDFSPERMSAQARKEHVSHRIGWLAEIADWIAAKLPVSAIRPDALDRLRKIYEPLWERRRNEASHPSLPTKNWDLMGRLLPSASHPDRPSAFSDLIAELPPITRRWRIAYSTPQEEFLARAQNLIGRNGD